MQFEKKQNDKNHESHSNQSVSCYFYDYDFVCL